jgi:predicted nuclease of restriction endonuclease-like (RecB) superfamily
MANLTFDQSPDYILWLKTLKDTIRSARVKASLAVNSELVQLYWKIGHEILERRDAKSWGSKVLEQLAKDLRAEFPDMSGLSLTNLKYMALFAEAWPQDAIGQQLVDQLPWGQNIAIISKIKDRQTREWYIRATIENGWSRFVLETQIELETHRRVGAAQTNFSRTLPSSSSDLAVAILKDPYNFELLGVTDDMHEREVEKQLITHLRDFLIELGVGFAFVGSQYHLEVDGDDYYVDVLFYHLKLQCYVVIELKTTEFKPEYVGKLNFYLAVIDDTVRDVESDKPTIGLILCKGKKKSSVEYALRGVDTPMGVSTYKAKSLPKELAAYLPSIEALEDTLKQVGDATTDDA